MKGGIGAVDRSILPGRRGGIKQQGEARAEGGAQIRIGPVRFGSIKPDRENEPAALRGSLGGAKPTSRNRAGEPRLTATLSAGRVRHP